MERRENSPLPINEVFGRIFEIEEEIDILRTQGDSRDPIRNLYLEKGYNFLLLLKARQAGSINLKVGLSTYPNETPHRYSQYVAEIVTPGGLNTSRTGARSGIDLISPGLDGDSRTIIDLIGQPEYTYNENADDMVKRTYDEVREIQRQHVTARSRFDYAEMEEMDDLRLDLVARILEAKKTEKLTQSKVRTRRFRGNRGDLMATVSLSGTDYIAIPLTPKIEEIFEKFGGFDKDALK